MHRLTKAAYTGLWTSILVGALYACTSGNFAGTSEPRGGRDSRNLTGNPGKGTGGNPGKGTSGNPGKGDSGNDDDANDGGNPGQGSNGDGNPGNGTSGNPGQGSSGDGNPGQGSTGDGNPGQGSTGDGNPGQGSSGQGDDGPGDDDVGLETEDENSTASLLIPMKVTQIKDGSTAADLDSFVFISRKKSDGSYGPEKMFSAEEGQAKTMSIPDLCHKKKATTIKVRVHLCSDPELNDDCDTISPPSAGIERTGGNKRRAEITVEESDGNVDRDGDNTFGFECPDFDLTVEGVN